MESKRIPNVVLWSWMRTVLNLVGSELYIFAYIFSQTFDNVHKCFTCLSEMEQWFGISRQTITRNIDKLCKSGYILKETLQDAVNPMIKHNNYRVDVPYITKLCEESDYDSYQNFLDSYRSILKQKFPNDSATIDEYLETLSTWHKNKDIKVCVTLNEVAQLVCMGVDGEKQPSIVSMIETIRGRNKSLKKGKEKDFIRKDIKDYKDESKKSEKQGFDFSGIEPKKKRVSKKAKQAEWLEAKKQATHSAVYLRLGGNDELYHLLLDFLETDNGMSYTPSQWDQQIDNMIYYGRTVDRMIDGVKRSYMNNYRTLYIPDKSEVDIDLKLREIKKYVHDNCDDNKELADLLEAYVLEVPKGKSYTISQFRLALENLSDICKTTDDKIKSVKRSYANSYASLAYDSYSAYSNDGYNSNECVDEEKKSEIIDEFIKNGYYYLCDGLEDALRNYVSDTIAGRSMTASNFSLILDNLRLFCLDDSEKVTRVKLAIQNNSAKFAVEDYKESQQIKDRLQTRESIADHMDMTRKVSILKEKQRNPKNPKIASVSV